jgi:hypothetical protein
MKMETVIFTEMLVLAYQTKTTCYSPDDHNVHEKNADGRNECPPSDAGQIIVDTEHNEDIREELGINDLNIIIKKFRKKG